LRIKRVWDVPLEIGNLNLGFPWPQLQLGKGEENDLNGASAKLEEFGLGISGYVATWKKGAPPENWGRKGGLSGLGTEDKKEDTAATKGKGSGEGRKGIDRSRT